jgi:phosphate-selective porin
MRARCVADRTVVALAVLVLHASPRARAAGQASDSSLARVGIAVLYDVSAFEQDSSNRHQLGTIPAVGAVRMDRLIISGVLRFPAAWSYLFSADYDGIRRDKHTAFTLNDLAAIVPLGGNTTLSVGRQKEGVMVQMMASTREIPVAERPAPLTAFVPTRNDGVRIATGQAQHGRWSLGWFNPYLTTKGAIPSGSNQLVGRGFATSGATDDDSSIVQVGMSAQWIGAPNGVSRFRTKPETDEAPDVVDTHSFNSTAVTTFGVDVVAQRRGWSLNAEAVATGTTQVDSGAVRFGGYYAEVSWRPGHEPRVYDAANGFLGRVQLRDHHGASELAVRFSHTDLSSRTIDGGVFDRTSVVASWYAPRSFRLLADYGYGVLRRGGIVGHMQFVTGRVQWELP